MLMIFLCSNKNMVPPSIAGFVLLFENFSENVKYFLVNYFQCSLRRIGVVLVDICSAFCFGFDSDCV